MEFASFHLQHHQLQEESTQCIASATPPHHYKPSTTTTQSWIPSNNLYNGSTNGLVLTESFTNSREVGHKNNMTDSLRISTEQVFDFHNGKSFTTQQPASEILNRSFSKAMNESCSSNSIPSFLSNLGVRGEFPEENVYNIHKLIDERVAQSKRFNIGHVSSISNLPIPSSSLVSHSLGLNHHQILDLLTSYNNNASCGLQPCYDAFGLNGNISLTHTNMHCCENSSSRSSNKISSFTIASEVANAKRPSNCSLPKESEAKAKKSRPSCSPLKVRKEKLGDRIQTLQRLVTPFGKTSTASVLSEAIAYIHFLHQQIQTLSIPYMKSAQSKPSRIMQLDSNKVGSREFKPDLRSRGLCLVPLSYASFIHRCT